MALLDTDYSSLFLSLHFLSKSFLSPFFTTFLLISLLLLFFYPGGLAWALFKTSHCIPGPPVSFSILSGPTPHRTLADLTKSYNAKSLMAFSVGLTRFVISTRPDTAKEILNSSAFSDRPNKEAASNLSFHRAIGFAPYGEYWRSLRRISGTHLFCPRQISAVGFMRRDAGLNMIRRIRFLMEKDGEVEMKQVLHFASLNNVMMSVFGKRYDFWNGEGQELERMVREGYELLGMFNWSDHLPLLGWLDLQGVRRRCNCLFKRVDSFVGKIIEEHREKRRGHVNGVTANGNDFVDVLLDLEKEEKLGDADMVAVLWEMIFRGTDTVAILLEWIMARMVLHPHIQSKAQAELDTVVGPGIPVIDTDIPKLRYLQSIVKESLRVHPPGPLLSWARLAVHDTYVGPYLVPAGTTAMVNMWAIAHDESFWARPEEFDPERFVGSDFNVLGSDLRLAPFGSGRRVCPGKTMGLATVHLWLAQLLQAFVWVPSDRGVDLSECLKMSLEMKNPLICKALARKF
ncbi:cytochrome P450 78A5-like protein [Carex littledalei]|uniref:Cytochrome P450 78A5-like protein n=1 Tax=Carex littledalei TaxID=544730 RepID=A0A833QXF8_9POAL|nr:cytochrome P450 78A5-like protein [Carex littledalei]